MLNRFAELENSLKATIAIIDADLHILTSEEWKICKELDALSLNLLMKLQKL